MITPQPKVGSSGGILQRIQRFVSPRVPVIHPRKTGADLFGPGVLATALHITHGAPISVFRLDGDGCLLEVAKIAQGLFAALAKWLSLLWRINGADADGDLLVRPGLTAAYLERVTIRDCHYQAEQGGLDQWQCGLVF